VIHDVDYAKQILTTEGERRQGTDVAVQGVGRGGEPDGTAWAPNAGAGS